MTEKITYSLNIQDTRLEDGITQFFSSLGEFAYVPFDEDIQADIILTDMPCPDGRPHYYALNDAGRPLDFKRFIAQILNGRVCATVHFADISFNRIAKTLTSDTGEETVLTGLEAELLGFLYDHQDQECSKETLLKHVWDYGQNVTTHTVETHIYRLRQKFPPLAGYINTTENGYMLSWDKGGK